MKKFIKIAIPIFILLIIYVYILAIESIPSNITVFQDENLNIKTLTGLKINGTSNNQTVEASSNKRK